MTSYRLTEFKSSDMDKVREHAESIRDIIATAGAESIDIISIGDGKALVIAKYATPAAMEAATEVNKQAFGKMIAAGVVDKDSIRGQSGEVLFSL